MHGFKVEIHIGLVSKYILIGTFHVNPISCRLLEFYCMYLRGTTHFLKGYENMSLQVTRSLAFEECSNCRLVEAAKENLLILSGL